MGNLPAVAETSQDSIKSLVLSWLATHRSVHTRRAYARDVTEWLEWAETEWVGSPLEATRTDAALFARHLDSLGLTNTTIARKLSAVSSWYSWLTREEVIPRNPFDHLARPEVDRDTSSTPGLTKDQALKLIAVADNVKGKERLRTSALVSMLLFTGARISELVSADIEDLATDRGHRVLRVTRKGGKRQALVLPSPVVDRLDAYLASRDDMETLPAVAGDSHSRHTRRVLFATKTGNRLFAADVWKLIRHLGKLANFPDDLIAHLGPHAMRHTFATLYLDAGGSLRDLQDAMGHSDPRTTRAYDRGRDSLDRSPGYRLAGYLT